MSNNAKTLDFSLTRDEQHVTIEGEAYVLIELDGFGRDKYLTNVAGRVRLDKGGNATGLKNFDGMEAGLVALCLKKVEGDHRRPVEEKVIQSWPGRVVTALFNAARDLSGLDKGEKQKEVEEDGAEGATGTEEKNA